MWTTPGTTDTTRGARARALVAGIAAACVLTGCGASDPGSETPQGSLDEKLTMQTAMDALKAAYDESRTGRFTMQLEGGGESFGASGVLRMDEESSEMQMQLDVGGSQSDLRVVDDVVYVQTPDSGGKYLRVDLDDTEDPLYDDFSQLAASGGLDSTFDAFDAGLRDVEFVESTDVDGEPVDHYVFTVDAEAALQAQGAGATPGLPDEIEYDVYLDSEDRFRRVEFAIADVTSRMEMTGWGEPVSIEAPAETEILTR